MSNTILTKKTTILLATGVVVAVCVVLFFYLRHQSTASNQNSDISAFHRYQNANTAFTYPSSFGVAQEEILEPGRNILVTSGTAMKIAFSNTRDVSLIAASTDFVMFKENAYTDGGHISALSCAHPVTFDTNGNGCRVRTVNGNTILIKTEYLADEGVYNLVRTFSLDIPSGDYRGLKIIQSFPSLYDQLNRQISEEERKNIFTRYAIELLSGNSQNSILAAQLRDADRIVQTLIVH